MDSHIVQWFSLFLVSNYESIVMKYLFDILDLHPQGSCHLMLSNATIQHFEFEFAPECPFECEGGRGGGGNAQMKGGSFSWSFSE